MSRCENDRTPPPDAVERLISLIPDDGNAQVPADLLRAVVKELYRAQQVAAVLTAPFWPNIPNGHEVRVNGGLKIGDTFADGAVVVDGYTPPPGRHRLVLVRMPPSAISS